MATDTTYNGWTNRETWLVGVWDFFDHEQIMEVIANIVNEPEKFLLPKLPAFSVTAGLAKWMEEYHDEFVEEETQNLNPYIKDHLSFNKINWTEIARHYDQEIMEALKEKA